MPKQTARKPHRVTFAGQYAKQSKIDEAQFGREVAIFNYGWLKGDDNGFDRGFIRCMKLIAHGPKNRRFWDTHEKRLAAKALRKRKAKA